MPQTFNILKRRHEQKDRDVVILTNIAYNSMSKNDCYPKDYMSPAAVEYLRQESWEVLVPSHFPALQPQTLCTPLGTLRSQKDKASR